jgi:hypothetical protein
MLVNSQNGLQTHFVEVTESSNKLIAQSEEFFKNYEEFRGSVNGVRETVEQVALHIIDEHHIVNKGGSRG